MHNPNAPARQSCTYTKEKGDGYVTPWRTGCGRGVQCEAPCEVGITFAPLPNAGGATFCPYCGGVIVLNPPEGRGEAIPDDAFARQTRAAFAQHVQAAKDHRPGAKDDEQPPR